MRHGLNSIDKEVIIQSSGVICPLVPPIMTSKKRVAINKCPLNWTEFPSRTWAVKGQCQIEFHLLKQINDSLRYLRIGNLSFVASEKREKP